MQNTKPQIDIVWFKRDLRLEDHLPLQQAYEAALNSGHRLLLIYIIEPEIWCADDASWRHWCFISDSLIELDSSLKSIGLQLDIFDGKAKKVFEELNDHFHIHQVWSHQETGNLVSYQRDIEVSHYLKEENISWVEHPQHAVSRAGIDRDHYFEFTRDFFSRPLATVPSAKITPLNSTPLINRIEDINSDTLIQNWRNQPRNNNRYIQPDDFDLGLNQPLQIQQGGRSQGVQLLQSFLSARHKQYRKFLSKPLGGDIFSSRLSAHLAYGTLSIREVMQALELATHNQPTDYDKRSLRVFQQRLFWQSHFMQKLESEPEIESHAMHPAYEAIRHWDKKTQFYFDAWKQGQTGFPLIDACMRCLIQTGWLPFRMRALLVSFASYQLWIPWQKTAIHLARLFTDYEPGIHYSQIQMQSGTTGINTIRIYNPVKQSKDQDAQGGFIRKWCPELSHLDNDSIHTPWHADLINNAQNSDYPDPIINLEEATQRAKQSIYAIKKQAENKVISQQVFLKHGSRSKQSTKRKERVHKPKQAANKTKQTVVNQQNSPQMELF